MLRLALSLIIFLAATPVLHAQDGTISLENSQLQDVDISARLREILDELGNYENVRVNVNEGVVTLSGTATSATEAADLTPLAERVEGVVAVKNEVVETSDIGARLNPAYERFRARVEQIVTFLPLAAIAGGVFIAILFVGILLARMKNPWDRIAPNAFIAEIYRQFVRIAFGVIGLVVALDIVNATALLSTILGAAGIVGLALGFAVRDTVENYIASVMLSIRQPFRPNDVVEINGDQGKVIRLTSRATILLSFDGNHIRIPNATVFKSRIINYSQNAERRFTFELLIDRDADLQQARDLAEDAVQALPFVLATPSAQSWIDMVETSGARLNVIGWIDQNDSSLPLAKGEAIRQVMRTLQSHGIALTSATQAISIERPDKVTKSVVPDIVEVSAVEVTQEAALDEMIAAERDTPEAEDLLNEDALHE